MTTLLQEIDSFDLSIRQEALKKAIAYKKRDKIFFPPPSPERFNLHIHTFHSYNTYGWSPSHILLEAAEKRFSYTALIDFDSLEAATETRQAGDLLNLPVLNGFETRVFIKEWAEQEINSPGEPGIFYLVGFGYSQTPDSTNPIYSLLTRLRKIANKRNRKIVERLNPLLAPCTIEYEKDVLLATPSQNPTERHIISAYIKQSRKIPDLSIYDFWADILQLTKKSLEPLFLQESSFQEKVRSILIKQGGPGYIPPDLRSFPEFDDVAEAISSSEGILTGTWLDGSSSAEKDPIAFLRFLKKKGIQLCCTIPERNWNISDPKVKKEKLQAFSAFTSAADTLGIPLICGTEMNKTGQPFFDDFSQPDLSPFLKQFQQGVHTAFTLTKKNHG